MAGGLCFAARLARCTEATGMHPLKWKQADPDPSSNSESAVALWAIGPIRCRLVLVARVTNARPHAACEERSSWLRDHGAGISPIFPRMRPVALACWTLCALAAGCIRCRTSPSTPLACAEGRCSLLRRRVLPRRQRRPVRRAAAGSDRRRDRHAP